MRAFLLFFILFNSLPPIEASELPQPIEKPTVVLVHGFLRSKLNMSAVSHSLKKEGWQVVNWSYPSRKRQIEEHSNKLILQLNSIARQHPNQPISFVTHSMGGLIVRCALNHKDCPEEAKLGRAVLIAPPNRGSAFARRLHKYKSIRWLFGGQAGKQLLTTPLDGFDHIGDFPKNMPILIISGTAGWNPAIHGNNDGKVAASETCLKTAHDHASSSAGHSWICYSPSVIKRVKAYLKPHRN